MNKLSICIVTRNNQEEILTLLHSIYKFTSDLDFEVFVVDNNSTDETVKRVSERFPMVNLIVAECNLGFGKAHNLVLNKIKSEYHLILNPDIIIKTNVIKELVNYLEIDNKAVMVTPKIISPNGNNQFLPKKNPKFKYVVAGKLEKFSKYFSHIRNEYTMSEQESKAISPFGIEFCTGCFMMIRSEIFKKLNGFDERFFMYLEDADLSRRARKYGEIMFLPKSAAVHAWHRESAKSLKFFLIHLSSLVKYLLKWKNDK